eukprot:s734_g6.t1
MQKMAQNDPDGETGLCDATLVETTNDVAVPKKSGPEKSVPKKSVPEKSVPEKSVPEKSVPEKSSPCKSDGYAVIDVEEATSS